MELKFDEKGLILSLIHILLRAAAAHFGLQPDQIMPGNGSDENLFFALRAFSGTPSASNRPNR